MLKNCHLGCDSMSSGRTSPVFWRSLRLRNSSEILPDVDYTPAHSKDHILYVCPVKIQDLTDLLLANVPVIW